MSDEIEKKKKTVFISYAWTSEKHKEWVRNLAEKLCENRVDVKLDQWDVKFGNDLYHYMEENVSSEDIDFVIMIFNKDYKEKADARKDGAGIEAQIISPKIYDMRKNEKYIGIVTELDEEEKPFVPIFYSSKVYIDFSNEVEEQRNFDSLLRHIYDKPLHCKPTLGNEPIFDSPKSTKISYESEKAFISLENGIKTGNPHLNFLLSSFYDALLTDLLKMKLSGIEIKEHYPAILIDKFHETQSLRDLSLKALNLALKCKVFNNTEFLMLVGNIICNFPERKTSDHIKLFLREFFIYSTCFLLKHSLFQDLKDILDHAFHIYNETTDASNKYDFITINDHLFGIDEEYKTQIQSNLYSFSSDLLINRYNKSFFIKPDFIDTDIFLCYYSLWKYRQTKNLYWFPRLYIYRGRFDDGISLMDGCKSLIKVKDIAYLFESKTKIEFQNTLKEIQISLNENKFQYQGSFIRVPGILQGLNLDEIPDF
ncbi:toll/interleukin-1 receptor domain-containing protein [bacterium]|nr:toll/interleukin-1 receptor domain-containing protein [bacterium]